MSDREPYYVGPRGEQDLKRGWTLTRSHPMTTSLDGPRLTLGESVEVVPKADLDALRDAAREMVAAWMIGHGERQRDAINRLEDLTGGQQSGS